jgi:Xaa-Pro aminopeptidase
MGQSLEPLRARMRDAGVDHYLVPSSDDHGNEYVPDCWQRRRFVSGFSGSAGDALIGLEQAWQWADSRYWLQAEKELDAQAVTLVRWGAPGEPTLEEWLERRTRGARVGVDPRVVPLEVARKLEAALAHAGGELVPLDANLVDAVWEARPQRPASAAVPLAERYAGRTCADKLGAIRAELAERGCAAHVLTATDAVAWTFNLRGRDVSYNPILLAYAVIERERARIFLAAEQVGDEARSALAKDGVEVAPYDTLASALGALEGPVWIDPASASLWVARAIAAAVVEAESPVPRMKACKNPVELAGMRAAHVRDGLAVVRFLHWLESAWPGGLDELRAADKLDAFRAEGERFQDLSFPTISGFGPNGAIVHYRVTAESALPIDASAPYLVDSGAQYLDGTTDVTRTVHLGEPRPIERSHYTRVLRGHLALRHTRFPRSANGAQLDAIARRPLWDAGLDYGHTTGHGVGCYLNVHERPPGIGPRVHGSFEPGMVVSNEPGLYLTGEYGIRIENLVCVIDAGESFLAFEDLTLAPYCRKLIATDELDAAEVAAVDRYHARVYETLAPLLDEEPRRWLERETAPL